jgi:hypothetical protein
MATLSSDKIRTAPTAHTLSVGRLAVATGITAAVVFVLCWLGTFVPFSSPTHGYITLFTNAGISSGLALAEGACWSLLFGLLVGAVFALIYNATASFTRK